MKQFLATIHASTQRERELVDITQQVREEVRRSTIRNGTCPCTPREPRRH